MELLLIGNIITCVGALGGFIYGAVRFFRPKAAVYAQMITLASGVIAFGRARILEDEEELRRAANAVGAKYSGDFEDLYRQETEETIRAGVLCCVEITVEHMTGKIGMEVLKERREANP